MIDYASKKQTNKQPKNFEPTLTCILVNVRLIMQTGQVEE